MGKKVTVIVPVYNTEHFIVQCIKSILNQTYSNIEIILVDDESPDRCPKICDNYARKDSRIRVIHKRNEGLGFVRNCGLHLATGDYVTFIDSDDWIDKNHIENLVQGIKGHDLVIGSRKITDQEGNVSYKREVRSYGKFAYNNIKKEILLPMIAPGEKVKNELEIDMSVCFNLYDIRIIRDNEIEFLSERYTVGEDIFFNLNYLYHCNSVNIVESKGYNYRMFSNSISHSYKHERIERTCAYYNELVKFVESHELKTEIGYRIERSTLSKYRSALNMIVNSDLSFLNKYYEVKTILNNDIFVKCLHAFPINLYRMSLKFTSYLMKKKLIILTILCFKLKNVQLYRIKRNQ